MNVETTASVAGATGSLIGGLWAYFSWILPKVREARNEKLAYKYTTQAMQDLLLGRPAGKPNPITGERGIPELPSISERFKSLEKSQEFQIGKLHEIQNDLQASNDNRFILIENSLQFLRDEIKTMKDAEKR